MLDLFDNLLREVLVAAIPGLTPSRVGFQPPNGDWRNFVSGQQGNLLNMYLFDLRENRKLRTNERERTVTDGLATDEPAPLRMDCHYLISAWSPIAVTQAVEPTVDEHALLYRVAAVLSRQASLIPAQVYPAGSPELNAWPIAFREADLPLIILPPDGFHKLAEFWSGMGQGALWKPVLYIVATVPVALAAEESGFLVTTTLTDSRIAGRPDSAGVWAQFGGQVRDSLHPLPNGKAPPVPNAWVRLERPTGERVRAAVTDGDGRFVFSELKAGEYKLRAGAEGLGPIERDIEVPSPTGEYDLQF
jgi:hypothetical protein